MEQIKKALGKGTEVIAEFKKKPKSRSDADIKSTILSLVERRPVSLQEMAISLGQSKRRLRSHLAVLERRGRVRLAKHKGILYYQPTAGSGAKKPPATH